MKMTIKPDSFQWKHKSKDVTVTVSGDGAPDPRHDKFASLGLDVPGGGPNPGIWEISDYDPKSPTEARIGIAPPAQAKEEPEGPDEHLRGSSGTLIITGQDGGPPRPMPPAPVTVS